VRALIEVLRNWGYVPLGIMKRLPENAAALRKFGAIDLLYCPPVDVASLASRGFPCSRPDDKCIAHLQQIGVAKVFITQCKRWWCEHRWTCDNTDMDAVLAYTQVYPQHFVGMASYNPGDISRSVYEAEIGIRRFGFRGIYLHPESYGVTLVDRRVYPLLVKAIDWRVPILVDLRTPEAKLGQVSAAMVEQVAEDFPELVLIIAECDWSELVLTRLAESCSNLNFCLDSRAMERPDVRAFAESGIGSTRSMWGSNGIEWEDALDRVHRLCLKNATEFLQANTRKLRLSATSGKIDACPLPLPILPQFCHSRAAVWLFQP
jgi:predicted TIM-barrel fold metal-dependent hydrolase